MTRNDMAFAPRPGDLWTALGLLTRLPLPLPPYDANNPRPAAHAAWAYPLAGLAVAVLVALVAGGALATGLPPLVAAVLAVLAGVVATGALHEDGLADCADGFWGGWSRERRLEIMKDSQLGSYGAIALVLALLLRVAALAGLLAQEGWFPALIAAAALSRAEMVWVMYLLPNARDSGLSQRTGRPPRGAALIAGGLAMAAALPLGGAAIPAVVLGVGAACLVGIVARAKIGGQTGDVLGATQQVTEIAVLLSCLAMVR